jgi:hypothetical protein
VGYTIPTPAQFKQQFVRDFPYDVTGFGAVPVATLGAGGSIVSVANQNGQTGQGYVIGTPVSISDPTGSGASITVATIGPGGTALTYLVSSPGSNYSSPVLSVSVGDDSVETKVTDVDIAGAIADAEYNMNEELFCDQATYTRAFLFLAAHSLVETMLCAVEGLASQYSWLTAAKSVDGVSQSFAVSERVREDPFLSALSTTRYGAKYLTIVLPFTVGHTTALIRQTNPV